LKAKTGNCSGCTLDPERLVPGHGCQNPDIMFIGEAPGVEEVAQGIPFVGRAGKLLRSILSALEIDTSRVYYTNACLCRPPANRTPKAGEIHACHERLLDEIDEIRPRIIVALGNSALVSLLGGGPGITKRRGIYKSIPSSWGSVGVIPSLHPAGILRSPDGFRDLADDIDLARRISGGEEPIVDPPYDEFVLVRSKSEFRNLIFRIQNVGGLVAIDLETEGLDPATGNILSMGLAWQDGSAWVLDWVGLISNSKKRHTELANAMAGIPAVFHNSQFDLRWLLDNGITPRLEFDTMLAHYCTDERQGSHGLKRLAAQVFKAPEYDAGLKPVSDQADGRKSSIIFSVQDWESESGFREDIMRYNAADAFYTIGLVRPLLEEMRQEGVERVHYDILIPAVRHFVRLEREGMLVDQKYLEELGSEWMKEISEIEERLRTYPGAEGVNLRSSKQVSEYLYDTLGLRKMPAGGDGMVRQEVVLQETSGINDDEAQEFWRTTQAKNIRERSTGTYMLYWLAQQHEFPRLLVRHRILTKQFGAYYDGYKRIMDETGRIRPRYRLHGTRTGRLSSTDPNIHGMPRRKQIKRIFIADPGFTLVSADYSQAEIRMVAHLANDDSLIRALGEADIHTAISKRLFNLTDEDLARMPEEERTIKRRAAKTIAFGMIYGRSAVSIAPQLGVSVREAEEYIESFFRMMPGVRAWIARQHALVMKEREVSTIFGRKRRFPFIADNHHAAEIRRQAVNFPVQSAVSDMTLMANMRIISELDKRGIQCRVWPHVHDGFYFQVESGWVDLAVYIAAEEMRRVPFDTRVPFTMEIQTGPNWGELKTVIEG
jgi:DNA polymerase I